MGQEKVHSKLSAGERRYVLRWYRQADDAALARVLGVPVATVALALRASRATRSIGDDRRLLRGESVVLPPYRTAIESMRRAAHVESRSLTPLDVGLAALVFLVSVVVYGLTAARTVTGEDAGELLAAAHGLGVPHPPGYPLWTLLGFVFDQLPVLTTAWRVSMVSGVFAALGNALLVVIALKTLHSRVAALLAGGLFAVSLTHWTQSVIPEVYGLNTFFLSAIALLLIRLHESPTASRLFLLAATAGLACTNHTSALAFSGLAAAGAVFIAPRLFGKPVVVMKAAACAVIPFGIFLLLPLFSAQDPYLDWGNPETTEALVEHVTRSQYAAAEADAGAVSSHADHLRRLEILGDAATRQFGSPWVLVLAGLGFVVLLSRQTGLALFLVAVGWLCSVGITRYTQFSFDREHVYANQIFLIPAWFALAWLIGGGADALITALRSTRLPASATSALAGIAVIGLVALPAAKHAPLADRSDTTIIDAYGHAILDVMDEGALYLPSSDHSTFAVMHHQGVLDKRLDVVIADKYGRIEPDVLEPLLTDDDRRNLSGFVGDELRREMESILIERWPSSVYFASRRPQEELPDGWLLEPIGPVFRATRADESAALWTASDDGAVPGLAPWKSGVLADVDLDDASQRVDFTVQMVRGDVLFTKGAAQLRAGLIDEAHKTWSRIDGDLAPLKQIFNNIGSMLAEEGRPIDALAFFDRALEEDADYVLGLRNKATVHLALDQSSHAIKTYQRLLDVPRSAKHESARRDARYRLAELLEAAERLHEALDQYKLLAEEKRSDPRPWKEAGAFLERHGDYARAIGAFTEARRLAPGDDSILERLERLQSGAAQLTADTPSYADEAGDPWLDPANMNPSGGIPVGMLPAMPPSSVPQLGAAEGER